MAKKVTKKALLASVLSLSICTTMLIGTSYAWFTDSVTSSGNIIKSGTLQVGMNWANGKENLDEATWNDVEQDGIDPMFYYDLWEPGYVQARHIQVFNKGSLALKYNLTILPAENSNYDPDAEDNIASVIDVYFYDPAQPLSDRAELTDANKIGTLKDLIADPTILAADTQGHLSAKAAGEADYPNKTVTLALKMQETAGNEYQDKEISAGFDVKLFATQWTEEEDTFDELYDKMATYDSTNVTNDLHLSNNGATVTVPAGSANVNDVFLLNVTNNGNNTDTDGKTTASFDVKLFKNGTELSSADINNTEYTVELDVGPNLDVVGVYHNSVPVLDYTYNATTGIVTFKTKSFSPFTVEYHEPKLITFDGNTGSGTMENQTVYAGEEAQLANNAFEKTGYSFAGWAETANGEVAYNDGESVKFTESKTLYAKWNANPYQISFNANGGTGNMANQTIYYDQTANLTTVGFTKDGYNFVGWATEENGAKVYDNGASYTMQSTTTVTLYAVWSAIDYDVVFNSNGGSGTMANQTITFDDTAKLTKNAFTKTGYSFAGWATTADGYATILDEADYKMETVGGVTLYATWTANNYDVVFNANGGTGNMANQSIAYDSKANLNANAFEKTGYSFAGWATSADGAVAYNDGAEYTMATVGGVTLYAKWTANNYDVVFNANGGSGNMANQSIAYDSTVNLTANAFTRTGYSFAGWATSANGNVVYTDGAEYTMNTEGATLYAVWTEIKPNSVTIKKDGTATTSVTTTTGQTFTLTAEVAPGTSLDTSVSWSSSNTNVAEVNSSGLVTAKTTTGTATIRATCNGNTSVYKECTVAVLLPVSYREYNAGTFTTKTANVVPLTANMTTLNNTGISNGWYAVTEDVTISGRITVSGTVHLILCDGKTLTASSGVSVNSGNTLNIYSQSEGSNQGSLSATSNSRGPAVIGGSGKNQSGGTIVINGGNITATGGDYSAGIGGGNRGSGGNITINGGTVTVNSSGDSGIGGGFQGAGGTITINGGTVTATSGKGGAGIGGGYNGAGGTITINGGTVTAKSTYAGAGIGGGQYGAGANVTVTGGTVIATGDDANGIGRGYKASDIGSLTVTGGLKVYKDYNCTQVNTDYANTRTTIMVIK